MDKYDEKLLMKIGIFISLFFVCLIIVFYSGIKVDFGDIFKKDKGKTEEVIGNLNIQNTVITQDISVDTLGRIIINLPGGVNEENTSIGKEIINKKITIAFPKGVGNYDNSNVENNADFVKNIDINVSEVMVKIDITLNSFRDCKICFDNGQLFLDFFDPATVDTPVIVIDPGHGGDDVGAIENGVYEKDIDLEICEKLKEKLDSTGILVYYTREDDSYPIVEERVDFANALSPDLFISVHSNWYDYDNISGTSVLYNVKDTSEYGSAWLSNILCQEVVKACGTANKGIVDGNDIHIVRHSNVPVALVEVGFMSNQSDFNIITSEKGQEKIANGIYSGIIRALTELGKY